MNEQTYTSSTNDYFVAEDLKVYMQISFNNFEYIGEMEDDNLEWFAENYCKYELE